MGEIVLRAFGVRFPHRRRPRVDPVRIALTVCAALAWVACVAAWWGRHG